MKRWWTTLLVSLCVVWPTVVGAAEIAGVRFSEAVRLDERSLVLNGVGLRAVAFIRGYAAGLYVPQKSGDAEALIGQKGPKRLSLHMLRQVSAADFIDALDHGLRRNLRAEEVQALTPRIDAFNRTLAEIGGANKGEVVDLDLDAEGNTRLRVNGGLRGQPVAGADFYAALMRVFIGERPVDPGLKKGLLGQNA